jgi:precorrin-3B C17-methyltransferase
MFDWMTYIWIPVSALLSVGVYFLGRGVQRFWAKKIRFPKPEFDPDKSTRDYIRLKKTLLPLLAALAVGVALFFFSYGVRQLNYALTPHETEIRAKGHVYEVVAGIYGMAGPVLSLASGSGTEIEIVPGVTAAISGAALLGAPLMNDFCVISLSDHLTPWERIEKRLRAAAEGDFVIALYNPMSRRRPDHLRRACELLLQTKPEDTVCGWVKNITREGQEHRITDLKSLAREQLDMTTTVFIGASDTFIKDGRMITPRGYTL